VEIDPAEVLGTVTGRRVRLAVADDDEARGRVAEACCVLRVSEVFSGLMYRDACGDSAVFIGERRFACRGRGGGRVGDYGVIFDVGLGEEGLKCGTASGGVPQKRRRMLSRVRL